VIVNQALQVEYLSSSRKIWTALVLHTYKLKKKMKRRIVAAISPSSSLGPNLPLRRLKEDLLTLTSLPR
jgi:hypothetical protein